MDTSPRVSNREFLEAHARPGLVGLAGGNDFLTRAIRRAQKPLVRDHRASDWSHVFLVGEKRIDGTFWVLESDLDIQKKQIRLGVQENRIEKYASDAEYPNLGLLDFGLDEEKTRLVLTEALDLLSCLTRYSLRELVGTLLSMRAPTLRARENLLAREGALYCSALVQHCYAKAGIDLAPGLTAKNTAPEHIAASPAVKASWFLRRGERA